MYTKLVILIEISISKINFIFLLLLAVVLASCTGEEARQNGICNDLQEDGNFVSVIQLRTTPRCFDNMNLQIQGVFSNEASFYYIYDNIESLDYGDKSKRVGLKFEVPFDKQSAVELDGNRVLIFGEFENLHSLRVENFVLLKSDVVE